MVIKMKSRFFYLFYIQILFMMIPISTPGADAYLNDTFTDTLQVDTTVTSAEIVTNNGWVTLSRVSRANALFLYPDDYNITLINNNKVETYRFNGTEMILDPTGSVSDGLNEPVALAGREGEFVVLDRGGKIAIWYLFDGSNMVPHWALGISGLNDPLALDAFTGNYDFALLDGNRVKRYFFDGVGLAPDWFIDFSTGSTCNPISISLIDKDPAEDGHFACVVLDKKKLEVKCYKYSGSEMVLDAGRSVQSPGTLTNPRSISTDEEGGIYLIADENEIKAFNYDGGAMVYNPHLSLCGLNKPLAVAKKPGSYEYAVLQYDEEGMPMIRYYGFDGSGMVELSGLHINGLMPIPYDNDQLLQGKTVTSLNQVTGLLLTAETEIPAGTSIIWEVTVDGVNWQPITNNGPAVKFALSGNKPNYRATLHTNDNSVTPKIFSICLFDASLSIRNFRIADIVGPPIPGNPVLPTDQKVKIWAGYNVKFVIETLGTADSITVQIIAGDEIIFLSSALGDLTPANPVTSNANTWTGNFHTSFSLPRGTLLDGNVTIKKDMETVDAVFGDFAEIFGSALSNYRIHLTH